MAFQNATCEGWADHAAEVADEMGLYADDFDRLGLRVSAMLMAVRLVVDTGMNALGWDRARAAAFMRAHLNTTDRQIESETIRYGADIPAQALGYALGTDHFTALRQEAAAKLGARFSIPDFHEAVLREGAVPLPALSVAADAWAGAAYRQ